MQDDKTNYKYSKILYNYAAGKEESAGNDDNEIEEDYMKDIPNSYNGPFAEDILAFKNETDGKYYQEQANQTNATEAEASVDPKTEGVRIGMTQDQVLNSLWGHPQSVNRTTTAYGVHEQWVYGGNNYLYFEDGSLTDIQN
jgi:hypothetical protein